MKKLCKILTAFVLTFTMVSNMAPSTLFAAGTSAFDEVGIVDSVFKSAILDFINTHGQSGVTEETVTREMLSNMDGVLTIDGDVTPSYKNLSSIKGFSYLGKKKEKGLNNTLSITIKNTSLAKLPNENDNAEEVRKPGLELASNAIRDVSEAKTVAGSNLRVNSFNLGDQVVVYDNSMSQYDNKIIFNYDRITDRDNMSTTLNLSDVLKNEDGAFPAIAESIGKANDGEFDFSKISEGFISIKKLNKSTEATLVWDELPNLYGNQNPWNGTITIPLKAAYKQDIIIDDGQGEMVDDNNNALGTASMDGTETYYGYGASAVASITPAKDRTTQYVRLMDDNNVSESINGTLTSDGNKYTISSISNVNHIHTKFTYIADIENITKTENLGGKLASEAGTVAVSEPSSDYSGNASDKNGPIKVGSTKIYDKDKASRTFTIAPTNTKEYEIDQIIINGKAIPANEYAANGIILENGVATFTINNINADQHVKASFKLKQKYAVKTEPKVSITGTDKNIGGSFDKNDITKYPGEDETVKASADTAKGYVIETMKVYTIESDGTLKLYADITEQAKNKDSYSYDVKNINANYKVEATFICYKNIKTEVVPNKTSFNNGLDGGSITKDIINIPLGSTETVKAEAKKNYVIDTFRILDKKDGKELFDLTDKANGQTVYEYEFKDIQQDYYVEVSFLKIHKIDTEIIPNNKDNASNDGVEHGKITDNYENIAAGDQRVIEIAADEGYIIYSLFIDGEEIKLEKGAKTYKKVYEKINDDHVVKVSFIREYPITTEVTTPGGSISTPGIVEDGDSFVVNITPDKGYEVDFDTLKNSGGVITKNSDGSVTIVYDHVINPEDIKVGFKKIVEPAPTPEKPAPTPEKPAEIPAPTPETPTGDTTSTLPLAGLAFASLAACGIVLKKRKSNIK